MLGADVTIACMEVSTEEASAFGVVVINEDQQRTDSSHDFGKDVLPLLVQHQNVYAYKFGGEQGRVTPDRYWRDVGTIDAYYKANMDLLAPVPPMDLYQQNWSIRTYQTPETTRKNHPRDFRNRGCSHQLNFIKRCCDLRRKYQGFCFICR